MITSSDSFSTVDLGNYYAILPNSGPSSPSAYCLNTSASRVPEGFFYDSGTNTEFLSVEEIRSLIRAHVNSTFVPV